MPISVRFTIRKKYFVLLCRLSVDGQEGKLFSPIKKGEKPIQVEGKWSQKEQKRVDRDGAEFNRNLRAIIDALESVYARQRTLTRYQPTPRSLQLEFQTGEEPEAMILANPAIPLNNLISVYQTYLLTLYSYKGTDNELAKGTLEKWQFGLSYLKQYQEENKWIYIDLGAVGVGWAKKYHLWLMKKGPMSVDSATRYVKRISEAIDSYIDYLPIKEQRATFNPIAGYKFGRAKTKDVYFLEKPHLEKFWQLDNRGEAGKCIWWMGVIFLTGLDYPDAVEYVYNRAKYEKQGATRPYIEIRRSKPPKALCRIPVWPELLALLDHVPPGEPPTANDINEYMKGVEVLTGFPHRLTCKIGRKTAGYIFLLRGYTIRAVSRILGQSSIAITERYYVRVTAELVQQEDDRLV